MPAPDGTPPNRRRRSFLKGLTSALAIAGLGSAAGHPSKDDRHPANDGSHGIHRHRTAKNTDRVGYHSLGGHGSEDTGGEPENHISGAASEVWVEGDYAFVSLLSTSEPTGNRGVAILDVSDYTRAESRAELDDAEMSVISFIGNENQAGTAADVKVSEDRQYLFVSKQAIGALYGNAASPSTDDHDAVSPQATGIEAYDISSPGNPEYLGTAQGPNAGFHNCFTHRIGGYHYVFGVQGVVAGDAGIHVYRLDESTGQLEPVNFWSGGDATQGEYDTDAANYYGHDFYMDRDPKNGRPVGYWAEWNNGVRVLDFSDPTDVVELGYGPMSVAHYAQPAPTLIDGKRVFVGAQELGSQTDGPSGYVNLFDGERLFDDGVTKCEKLASWTLYGNVSYSGYAFSPHNADITADGWITQSHYHAGVRFLKIRPPSESADGQWHLAGRRVRTNPTDGDRTKTDKTESFSSIMTPGGPVGPARTTATHRFTPPSGVDELDATLSYGANQQDLDLYLDVNTSGDPNDPTWERVAVSENLGGPESVSASVSPGTLHRFVVATYAHAASRYTIEGTYYTVPDSGSDSTGRTVVESGEAYYSDHVEVPASTQTFGSMAPNFWGARIENGVTFASGINTGLYAIAADPIDVGTRTAADVEVARTDDGTVFTGGQTDEITFTVETDHDITLRTRIPTDWSVVGGDDNRVRNVGDGIQVTFTNPVAATEDEHAHSHGSAATRTLFVEAPKGVDTSDAYRFGPVQYSVDGGETWEPVPGTTSTELVFGGGT